MADGEARAWIALVGPFAVVALFWGFNYPMVVLGLRSAPPLWLAFFRALFGLVGSIALFPVLARQFQVKRLLPWRLRWRALLLGVPNTAIFFGLWLQAATSVPAGQTSVLVYTFPIWVLLLASVGLGERLGTMQVAASVLGLGGVAIIGLLGARNWVGGWVPVLELLGAAVSWAVATILLKRWFRREEMLEANALQLTGALLPLGIAAWWSAPLSSVHFTSSLWIVLLWVGLLGTAVAYALWFELLSRYRAATLSAYLFVVPMVAIGAGFLLLGQGLGIPQAIGVAAILISIYLTHRAASRTPGGGSAPQAVEGGA